MSRRGGARPVAGVDEESTQKVGEVLEQLTPGAPLREALDRVLMQGAGALVVMGGGPRVEEVCTGGFRLQDSPFTPARVAELAKMDGAIILDDACRLILAANVQLHPDASLATDETGSRHRTAERVARQVGKPVIAVSEERAVATLYVGGSKHHLANPADLVADVNQSLVTLERFRRRLDEAVERLTRLEVSDQMTYRGVVVVLQRAELVLRIGAKIGLEARQLGAEGSLVELQLADLRYGVEQLRGYVLKDYGAAADDRSCHAALAALEGVPEALLTRPDRVAAALGFEHVDTPVRPPGYRLLAQVPRLPETVREALVEHFESLQSIVHATAEQLAEVEGIGQTRAAELRRFFDRMNEGYHAPLTTSPARSEGGAHQKAAPRGNPDAGE
jgi:diadenylate cyclase